MAGIFSRASLLGLCVAGLVGTLCVLSSTGFFPGRGASPGERRLQATTRAGQIVDHVAGRADQFGDHVANGADQLGDHLYNKGAQFVGGVSNVAGHVAGRADQFGDHLANHADQLGNHAVQFGGHVYNVADHVAGRADQLGDHVFNRGAQLGGHISNAAGHVAGRADQFGDHVGNGMSQFGGHISNAAGHVAGRADQFGDHVGNGVSQFGGHISNAAGRVSNGAGQISDRVRNGASEIGSRLRGGGASFSANMRSGLTFSRAGASYTNPFDYLFGTPANEQSFQTCFKVTVVCLQVVFAVFYYCFVVSRYPYWMAPTPMSVRLQAEAAPCATVQTSLTNCVLSWLCPQARAAHTFDKTGILEYWCGCLAMFLCPCCTLCFANACTDLNQRLGGQPQNVVSSVACTWCCSCCVIAQDAESLDAATGVKTEFCGISGMPMPYGQPMMQPGGPMMQQMHPGGSGMYPGGSGVYPGGSGFYPGPQMSPYRY